MSGLVWFREDIRTIDNTALYYASCHCHDGIAGIYFIDPAMWKLHDTATCRINFVLEGLERLRENLAKSGISLIVQQVKQTADIPQQLLKIMQQEKFSTLFFNRQYEVNERYRDEQVNTLLTTNKYEVLSYDDQVILPPGVVKTKQNTDYSMFTPFKRAWYTIFRERNIQQFPQPKNQQPLKLKTALGKIPHQLSEFHSHIDRKLWPAGQTAALKNLDKFIKEHLFDYANERDFPALDTTSKLSAYLAAGMISPRQCFLAAFDANHQEFDSGHKGAITWMGELVWREFYKHLLISAPRVSMHKPFKKETESIAWEYNSKHALAWQQGKTGYPIIDAAMRQLNSTGWMHNRLRMIVAMFYAKNLFFDWREGEKYFMSQLIDGDLAANNGGWQWCASTGTDAAPYFRIFNPLRQSMKFDAQGEFIKKYCPELKDFDAKSIHEPYLKNPALASKVKYPKPIIELNVNRGKVMKAFRKQPAKS